LKFFLPIIATQGPAYIDLKERLEKLAGNMSLTRKVLRFGKPLSLVKSIMDRIKQHEKSPVRMVFWRTLSDISLILYFLTDHPLYFHKIGLIKLDKKTAD
jgi:hypothetical protein